jgi:chaperone required for assembly of F1-ATPase
MRPNLRKRFYQSAAAGEGPPHSLLLDGRPVKTPAGATFAAPVRPLVQAIAAEWDAQGERIDPATMPLTRLANTIIDGVEPNPDPVADEIAKYLGSDLVCYRADTPEGLVRMQSRSWDPILMWARERLGARFVLTEGVVFVEQPEHAVKAAQKAIPYDPWRLGAAHVVTTLTGSALIALAVAAKRLSVEEAWAAAHVDEDWNMDFWGRDELAMQRRAARFAEMRAAGTVLALTD